MADTITVEGRASRSVPAERMELRFTLVKEAPGCAGAMDAVAEASSRLDGAVSPACPKGVRLKTEAFSIDAVYATQEEGGARRSVPAGVRCTQTLSLSLPFDKKTADSLLSAAAACGAEPEIEIRFVPGDTGELKKELMRAACADARQQAEILSEALGRTLSGAVSVEFSGMSGDGASPVAMGRGVMRLSAVPNIDPADGMCECRVHAVFGLVSTDATK